MSRRDGWTWRTGDRKASSELRLLYEPGGFGDVLKGLVMVELCAATLEDGPVRVADPFAGALSYPLVGRARACLETSAGIGQFEALQRAAGGRLASTTALLVHAFPKRLEATVFDADAERRATWSAVDGARVLDVESGWDALSPGVLGVQDVVLVDPYDLTRSPEWPGAAPGLRALRGSGAHLLFYVYNRAPQSAGELAAYRRFRDRFAAAVGPADFVGRVPSDALLARAWHEVVLVAGKPLAPGLVERLTELTERLAWAILRSGVTERADTRAGPG